MSFRLDGAIATGSGGRSFAACSACFTSDWTTFTVPGENIVLPTKAHASSSGRLESCIQVMLVGQIPSRRQHRLVVHTGRVVFQKGP
jgi:hypothetical protein